MQSISPVAQANWSGEHVGGSAEGQKRHHTPPRLATRKPGDVLLGVTAGDTLHWRVLYPPFPDRALSAVPPPAPR